MTVTKKRARELARAKEDRRRAKEAALRAKRKRRRTILAVVVVIAILLLTIGGFLLTNVFSDDQNTPSAEPPESNPAGATKAVDTITQGDQVLASCHAPGELQATPLKFDAAGDSGLGAASAASFTFTTNCGDIVINADASKAPQTVGSMAFLANQGFFNQTLCHRLTTDGLFVLQCGDPTATGTGGPGYTVPDENLPQQADNNYPAGTVAMANGGPNTAGSQFFIVYKDTTLPANYTVWGTVTSGLDIVQQVAGAGTSNGSKDGPPKQAVMIQGVTVAAQ